MINKHNLSFGISGGHDLNTLTSTVKMAENKGFKSCWIFEDYFYGGAFSTATACALNTEKMEIGIGVINPFTRHPVLTAMEAAALDSLSNGRFILGMGASNKTWIQEMAGITYIKPIQTTCEAVDIIKRLIADRTMQYEGEIFKTGKITLDFEPYRNNMPIYLGVKGPKALFRAGQVADGVVLSTLSSVPYIEYAKEHIAKGAESVGRDPYEIKIAAYFPMYVNEDSKLAKEKVRRNIADYIGMHGLHPIMFTAGFDEAFLTPFIKATRAGRTEDVIDLVTDDIVNIFAVAGNRKECLKRLDDIKEVGVDMPVAQEITGEDFISLVEILGDELIGQETKNEKGGIEVERK